jgi:hypothetical protein
MTDPGALDPRTLLDALAAQQALLSQQLSALLALQTETARAYRLLLRSTDPRPAAAEHGADGRPADQWVEEAEPAVGTPPQASVACADDLIEPVAPGAWTQPREAGSTGGQPAPGTARVPASSMGADPSTMGGGNGTARRGMRAERYLQRTPGRAAKGVSRQQLERLRRLHATGEAGQLVLQFGHYRGTRLVEIADHDPDYVRSLALTAQRPQVRAAARALVLALEWSDRRHPASRPRKRTPGGGSSASGGLDAARVFFNAEAQ